MVVSNSSCIFGYIYGNMKKGQKPNYNLETIRESVINGISLNELAKEYNVCPSSLGRFLRKQGVNYNLQVRRISKNKYIWVSWWFWTY